MSDLLVTPISQLYCPRVHKALRVLIKSVPERLNDARADSRRRASQLPQINRRLRSIDGAASDARWRSSVVADLQDNLARDRMTLFRREGIASIGKWQHLTNNRSQLSRINPA
jgi:hypothetical protein